MQKNAKNIIIVVAVAVVLVFSLLIAVLLAAGGEDVPEMTQKTYEVADDIVGLGITAVDGDVKIMTTDKEKAYVVYYENSDGGYDFYIRSGILNIERRFDTEDESIYIMDDDQAEVCVYLPEKDYTEFYFESDSGDVEIDKNVSISTIRAYIESGDFEFRGKSDKTLLVRSESGDVEIEGAELGEVQIAAVNGDVSFERIVADGDVILNSDKGEVDFEDVKAKSLTVNGKTVK